MYYLITFFGKGIAYMYKIFKLSSLYANEKKRILMFTFKIFYLQYMQYVES